ncbi:unnamed protein product [Cyprideis torosa]|uniref:Uncharacterized protein n=1 Tax=Cyprideis torosa TaxID=163714 RepID=A0A7R8W3V7_9CRUS|nr:unnamed protein product [Cyprideis torosa]CAG0878968.1 unnamed protein product [Cyprideis torosa]
MSTVRSNSNDSSKSFDTESQATSVNLWNSAQKSIDHRPLRAPCRQLLQNFIPLAHIARILGVFPLKDIGSIPTSCDDCTRFQWVSFPTFWSLLVYPALLVAWVLVDEYDIPVDPNGKTKEEATIPLITFFINRPEDLGPDYLEQEIRPREFANDTMKRFARKTYVFYAIVFAITTITKFLVRCETETTLNTLRSSVLMFFGYSAALTVEMIFIFFCKHLNSIFITNLTDLICYIKDTLGDRREKAMLSFENKFKCVKCPSMIKEICQNIKFKNKREGFKTVVQHLNERQRTRTESQQDNVHLMESLQDHIEKCSCLDENNTSNRQTQLLQLLKKLLHRLKDLINGTMRRQTSVPQPSPGLQRQLRTIRGSKGRKYRPEEMFLQRQSKQNLFSSEEEEPSDVSLRINRHRVLHFHTLRTVEMLCDIHHPTLLWLYFFHLIVITLLTYVAYAAFKYGSLRTVSTCALLVAGSVVRILLTTKAANELQENVQHLVEHLTLLTGPQLQEKAQSPIKLIIDRSDGVLYNGLKSDKLLYNGLKSDKLFYNGLKSDKLLYNGLNDKLFYNGLKSDKLLYNGLKSDKLLYNGLKSDKLLYNGLKSDKLLYNGLKT